MAFCLFSGNGGTKRTLPALTGNASRDVNQLLNV